MANCVRELSEGASRAVVAADCFITTTMRDKGNVQLPLLLSTSHFTFRWLGALAAECAHWPPGCGSQCLLNANATSTIIIIIISAEFSHILARELQFKVIPKNTTLGAAVANYLVTSSSCAVLRRFFVQFASSN